MNADSLDYLGTNPRAGFGFAQVKSEKMREIYDWFTGRVGDHLPNEHYQRLLPELVEILTNE